MIIRYSNKINCKVMDLERGDVFKYGDYRYVFTGMLESGVLSAFNLDEKEMWENIYGGFVVERLEEPICVWGN